MTREKALKHIEELEKIRNGACPNSPSVLELYQDLADYHGLSLEKLTEKMMIIGGVGFTRPIRVKSCEYCKYFEQIPKKLSLGDLEQDYFRFCIRSGLHEPIDETWQLEHEICFCKKGE